MGTGTIKTIFEVENWEASDLDTIDIYENRSKAIVLLQDVFYYAANAAGWHNGFFSLFLKKVDGQDIFPICVVSVSTDRPMQEWNKSSFLSGQLLCEGDKLGIQALCDNTFSFSITAKFIGEEC